MTVVTMSMSEVTRLEVLSQVQAGGMRIDEAAEQLNLTRRHAQAPGVMALEPLLPGGALRSA
ncbi:MAG TPA: hypothetical protein VEB20_23730 [Azospirillaceae bacterium]|nr:hypothetical protein [Azospirillaceae bacterium]